MKIAHIEKNEKYDRLDVTEIYEQPFIDNNTDWDTNPPSWGVELPDDSPVSISWKLRDGVWEAPEIAHTDDAKIDKREEIALARWRAETGGVEVGGVTIATDRESQALITGAALQAIVDPAYSCRWKTAGGFIELTAPMIVSVATAVRQYVQSCFDREAGLVAQIEAAGSVEEVRAISWNTFAEEPV